MDNPYPNITKLIEQDLSPEPMQNFQLIRAKSGVYVYNCLYNGTPAVVKYFEKEDDRREILNYRILGENNIPTIKTLALGKVSLVMEDISVSKDWRLGIPEDFEDTQVAKSLAMWYFTLHENGSAAPELDSLYFEYDSITKENLQTLIHKFPEGKELLEFVLTHFNRLRELIYQPTFTLTYNDFYWSNFVVRKDKQAAIMFDYNLLGKGYRFSDFRNVCWSISENAKTAFTEEYYRMYFEKYGRSRQEDEEIESRIYDLAASLFTLIVAFIERESFPSWAEETRTQVLNGDLLCKAKELFT